MVKLTFGPLWKKQTIDCYYSEFAANLKPGGQCFKDVIISIFSTGKTKCMFKEKRIKREKTDINCNCVFPDKIHWVYLNK